MKYDMRGPWRWTALLPDGKRVRLEVAEGVRLTVGDVLWIGGALYSVVKRQMDGERPGWNLVVRKGTGMESRNAAAARTSPSRRQRLAT